MSNSLVISTEPKEPNTMKDHTLTTFSAFDVPEDVQRKVMTLLDAYNPDIDYRNCDENGY